MSSFTKREFQRFYSRIALPDENGCMLWTGLLDSKGYGRTFMGGVHYGAHRFSLRHFEGEPAEAGLHAAHSCANHNCVAPAHLRWATPKENEADKGVQENRVRGEETCTAKLTNAEAQVIRELASQGVSRRELQARYGVSKTTIAEVVLGKRYRLPQSRKAGA